MFVDLGLSTRPRECFARVQHRPGERDGFVGCHSLKVDCHCEGRHLIGRNFFTGKSRDHKTDLFFGQFITITLGRNKLSDVHGACISVVEKVSLVLVVKRFILAYPQAKFGSSRTRRRKERDLLTTEVQWHRGKGRKCWLPLCVLGATVVQTYHKPLLEWCRVWVVRSLTAFVRLVVA